VAKVLTKQDLAKQIKNTSPYRLMGMKAIVLLLETVFDLIVCHLQNGGEKVTIRGFGSFKLRTRRGYTGTNPQTGDPLQIPQGVSISFKPGAEVARRLNWK
jgi:integration host factor subunit beta